MHRLSHFCDKAILSNLRKSVKCFLGVFSIFLMHRNVQAGTTLYIREQASGGIRKVLRMGGCWRGFCWDGLRR